MRKSLPPPPPAARRYSNIYGCEAYPGIYFAKNETQALGAAREELGGLRMYLCLHATEMPIFSATYWILFVLISALVVLSLFIGSVTMSMSEQMKEMRAKMEEDESTKAMMQALRGTNLNDDDSAAQGTTLRVVETRAGDDQLPLTYQPELLADYFGKRPLAVLTRIGQIMGTSAGWLSGVAIRALKGELAPGSAAEVESVAELRSIIVSLGPFFIKLGQALSIRPDILSPQAMVELQQLCESQQAVLANATRKQSALSIATHHALQFAIGLGVLLPLVSYFGALS